MKVIGKMMGIMKIVGLNAPLAVKIANLLVHIGYDPSNTTTETISDSSDLDKSFRTAITAAISARDIKVRWRNTKSAELRFAKLQITVLEGIMKKQTISQRVKDMATSLFPAAAVLGLGALMSYIATVAIGGVDDVAPYVTTAAVDEVAPYVTTAAVDEVAPYVATAAVDEVAPYVATAAVDEVAPYVATASVEEVAPSYVATASVEKCDDHADKPKKPKKSRILTTAGVPSGDL
jgi:hypothetical protein